MLKNVIKVLFSNLLLTIVGLINSFIFPGILSLEDYAQYQTYMLYLNYINICQLGLSSGMFINYGGKDYEDTKKSQYKSEIILLIIFLSTFSILGFFLGIVQNHWIIVMTALTILPYSFVGTYKALYQAWGQFNKFAIYNSIPSILFTALTILLFWFQGVVEGKQTISMYVGIQWIVAIILFIQFLLFTKHTKSEKLLSKTNQKTITNGMLLLLGNYINLLFHALDKQFVSGFYSVRSFAMYSFAMSTYSILAILVTALANPFYPRLAKGDYDHKMIKQLKECLFMLGSLAGCAYYVVSVIVTRYIPKYTDSMQVIAIFFAAFPAMAVINVMYINLYKIKRLFKKYIATLVGMLIVAAVFNFIAVALKSDYVGISVATFFVYYVWLFFSKRHFSEVIFNVCDYLYLAIFLITYFACIFFLPNILGFVLYIVIMLGSSFLMYKQTILDVLMKIFHKYSKKVPA